MDTNTIAPLALSASLYLWTAFGFIQEGKIGMMVVFAAYTVGNIGFIMAAKGI